MWYNCCKGGSRTQQKFSAAAPRKAAGRFVNACARVMELSEKLVKLRQQKGLTQEELAAKIFVTRTAVSKWENGKGYPAIDSLKLLSEVYGISIDELISDDDVVAVRNAKRRRSRIFYWCAVGCIAAAAVFAAVAAAADIVLLLIPSAVAVAGYVVFAFLSRPFSDGAGRADLVRYIACRLIVLAIVVAVLVTTLIKEFV